MQNAHRPTRKRRPGWLPAGLISQRNVELILATSVLGSIVVTIAHGHIFTAFVFELYGDNTSVGYVESVSGMTALMTALPVGMAVDKMPRTWLLRGSAGIGLLAAALGAFAVVLGPKVVTDEMGERQKPPQAYTYTLLAALALWGVFFNTTQSASLALFADSVPKGAKRVELYATKSTLTLLALAVGPLVGLVCNMVFGNDWNLEHMTYAILPGFFLVPLMCGLLTRFEEVRPPREAEHTLLEEGRPSPSSATSPPSAEAERPAMALLYPRMAAAVPYLLLMAELITSIGAGMTVKFFGLWFKNDFHFSPAGISMLQATTPVCIAVAVQALQRTARACPWGPVPVVLAFWLASVIALLIMTQLRDWRLLVILHLFRTAMANCKEPISRAILADFIPSHKRGRWNAVHSLTGMTWTGSAALGGVLCDRYGYGKTFFITAGLYVVAAAFWLPLIPLVPQEKRQLDKENAEGTDADDKVKGA